MTAGNEMQWYGALASTDDHLVELAKLEFALGLERLLMHNKLSKSNLAKLMHTSPAYITKVMRGDANVTIETIVKLVNSAGGEFSMNLRPKREDRSWSSILPAIEETRKTDVNTAAMTTSYWQKSVEGCESGTTTQA